MSENKNKSKSKRRPHHLHLRFRDMVIGAILLAFAVAIIMIVAFGQTQMQVDAPITHQGWDWTAITTAATAILMIVGLTVNSIQNILLKWEQQAAAAAAVEAATAAKAAADLVQATALHTVDTVKQQVEGVMVKIGGMELQLDGKLEKWQEGMKIAAHASGVLEERTRHESETAAVTAAIAGTGTGTAETGTAKK